jgi:phage anti-repressor protein
MIGFANKGNAMKTIRSNFIKDEDYKVTLFHTEKRKNEGGFNKENIMLNIDTLKNLCMIAKTQQGKEIRKYYVKLENIYNRIIKEEIESKQLLLEKERENAQKLLTEKENELVEKDKQLSNLQKLKVKRWYNQEPGHVIYGVKINNGFIKIGKSKNIKDRESHYVSDQIGEMFFIRKCFNCDLAEKVLHHILDKFRIEKNKEWFEISDELCIYIIDIACDFLDNFINDIDKLPSTSLKDIINKISTSFNQKAETNEGKVVKIKDSTTILNKEIKKELVLKEFDYDSFINESCELNENYNCIPDDLLGAYKIWSRQNVDTNKKNLLFNYIKTKFKVKKIYTESYKSTIGCFIGIKPKTLDYNIQNNLLNEFLISQCDIGYIYKITEKQLLDSYSLWLKRDISTDELINIKAELNKNFYFGNVNISKEKKKYGYVGIKLKSEKETLHCLRNKNTKKINKINVTTKQIEQVFISIGETAHVLNIDYRTVMYYIKQKKIFDAHYMLDYRI